jgi:hypothetical protein
LAEVLLMAIMTLDGDPERFVFKPVNLAGIKGRRAISRLVPEGEG